jgi:hypothetical protein
MKGRHAFFVLRYEGKTMDNTVLRKDNRLLKK